MSLNSHLPPLRGSLLLSTMTQKHCEDSGGHWRGVGAICNEQQERGGGVTLADVAPTHPPTFYLFLSPYLHNSPYHPTHIKPPQGPSPLHPLICQHFPFSSPPYTTQHSLLCLLMLLQSCNSCKSMITLVTFKRTYPAQSKIYFVIKNFCSCLSHKLTRERAKFMPT